MVFTAGIAAKTGAQQEEQRPDTLAAAIQDMRRDGINKRDTGGQIEVDPIFNSLELTPIGIPDVRHRVNRGGDRTLWHAADGRAAKETKSRESQRNPRIDRLTEESPFH